MYQNRQLGFIDSIMGSIFGGGGGGSGGSAPITVSPNISTQVSPQISPVFQQQFQPQNSAATAGTAMTGAPTSAGAETASPGYLLPSYGSPGTGGNNAVPQIPGAQTDWVKYMPYALAGLGILALVSIKKRAK